MDNNQKQIIATVFIKNGALVKSFSDHTPEGDVEATVHTFNDCGFDRICVFDLSDSMKEREQNLNVIRTITEHSEIPVYCGGSINSVDDIKKVLYLGCKKAVLNSLKEDTLEMLKEGAERFGKERMALSVFNVDIFFKNKAYLQEYTSEVVVLNDRLPGTMESITDIPYTVYTEDLPGERIAEMLASESTITGISCKSFSRHPDKILHLKNCLLEKGIMTGHLSSAIPWSEFKLNEQGMVPVVVQDYKTNEVLMLAYMNEEAYYTTLSIGKMTYWSRSRNELWIKGLTSGHYQYVKSLTIDCDRDTILAKVSQVGAACHTGNRTCFFTDLTTQETADRNLFTELEREYTMIKDRKMHPKEGSYTTSLFESGLDPILKKMGKEFMDILIAAKGEDKAQLPYEVADYLYHMMVMMVEKDVPLSSVIEELALR